ncbi:MAG: PAS domain-containing protein [Bacteroidia bacterium]
MKDVNNIIEISSLDNLVEGCQIIGYDWKYLYLNDVVLKQSKFRKKEELLGFTMMEKYPGIENTEMFGLLKKCMTTRVSEMMINEFTFPDGSVGWFELRFEPVPQGIFILSVDVTVQRNSELERKRYIDSLEEMLYMTSHKVRQPICSILGIMNVLDSVDVSKEDVENVVEYMKKSIINLDVFTRELTGFISEKMIDIKATERRMTEKQSR